MDVFALVKWGMKKLKLFVLYWRRIVFAKNHFKCPWYKKIRANLTRGFLADQWILYDLDHNDKDEYLSEFDWYRSRYINDPFDFVCNNKIVSAEVLKQYVRVPESYMIKNQGHLSGFHSEDMEYEDALKLLEEKKLLFYKPYGKGKGMGVCRLSWENGQPAIDMKPISEEDFLKFLKKNDDWFLSEAMQQHHYSDEIYDQTVNTIRFITLRDPETHKFKVFFAVQRIGTKETIPVDNGSRGGLVAKIDLETGELSEGRCLHNKNVYKVHPDSGAPIEGVVIPGWEKLKEDMLDLANHLPYMHFIAWDILITEEGFCIIEANTSSGVNIIQLWGGQRNKELGNFYRYHKVIK